jgi:hypothetical protein
MFRRIAVCMFLVGLFASVGAAQSKPDFSGTWNLNVTKSDFGPVPGPSSETIVIAQTGSDVKETAKYEDDQGKHDYTLAYATDGTQIVYPADSAPVIGMVTLQKLKAVWQGNNLVMTEALKYQEDGDVTGTITRALSADGKVMTVDFDLMTPMGAIARKMVFDHADAAAASAASSPAAAMAMSAAPSSSTAMTAAAPPAAAMAMKASAAGMNPNLSGTWKLNVAKSDFGEIPAPDSRTEKIEDNEPSIKISSSWTGGPMGDGTMSYDLLTNGKETTSSMFGTDAKNTANWEGSALVVNTKFQMQDSDVALKSKYELSPDGKTLNIASHISGPMGEMEMKMVYEKQP